MVCKDDYSENSQVCQFMVGVSGIIPVTDTSHYLMHCTQLMTQVSGVDVTHSKCLCCFCVFLGLPESLLFFLRERQLR